MRASGALPPRAGPRSRATELAALALANLAADNTARRAIRLSGGVPPLARLLTLRPSAQARGRPAARAHSLTCAPAVLHPHLVVRHVLRRLAALLL